MNQVFFTLFLLSLAVLLMGLIKPNAVLPRKIRGTRTHVWLVYGSVATLLLLLFGMTLPDVQATIGQGVAVDVNSLKGVNQSTELLKSDKLKAIASEPSKYVGYPVDVTSKVSTQVQVISNISKFQIWADPVFKKGNIIVVYTGNVNVIQGDTIRVKGTVGKKLSGQGPNGDTVEAVCIIAQSIEKVSQ